MSHVVFVGLGFGGLYTLKRFIKHAPEGVHITAIHRRDRFVFTPLLYEYLDSPPGRHASPPCGSGWRDEHDEVAVTSAAGRPWRGS